MQINRLFEIVYILLDKKKVTARELAERFEVSTRTIYRDVETLSASGVPVYMQKGRAGGIGLLPEFVLNKALLSEQEQGEILSALKGLNAAEQNRGAALPKLLALFGGKPAANWVEIDFSDWNPQKQRQFDLIKQAILEKRAVRFDYHNTNGEFSSRVAEPVTLWFKSRAWYLRAFCRAREDFRIFKLSRVKNLELTEETFPERPLPDYDEPYAFQRALPTVRIKFDPSCRFRLYDDFDDGDLTENPDGSITATVSAPVDDWFVGYALSFGDMAEILSPAFLREHIRGMLEKTLEKYQNDF